MNADADDDKTSTRTLFERNLCNIPYQQTLVCPPWNQFGTFNSALPVYDTIWLGHLEVAAGKQWLKSKRTFIIKGHLW